MTAEILTYGIAGLATAGVILRPLGWPEAVWAVLGAMLLLLLGLVTPAVAWKGVAAGLDVYLFLTGMMLLSELARREGLFDWLAAIAVGHAKGSARRLFGLVYLVGIVVTVLLSNDATAVVLTPAVYAATTAARIEKPLPYLLICAFIANAASFVLPISNPANLVIFNGGHMPVLTAWLAIFALPSAVAIAATFAALRWCVRADLAAIEVANDIETPQLSPCGRTAGIGIMLTALALLSASAVGIELGLPTLVCGVATALAVIVIGRESPWPVVREISWGVLPLVAGLFVLVEALDRAGLAATLAGLLREAAGWSVPGAAGITGLLVAFVSNAMNNLPAGLVAAGALQQAQAPPLVTNAVLIGVDLGPNLSVTGSLATILWLNALRREGQSIGGLAFLRIGAVVMPPALLLALLVLLLQG